MPGPVAPPAPEPEPPAAEGEAPARGTPVVPEAVQEYLDASRGGGTPLPPATRETFETAYRRPLDDVRIHDDGAADAAARAIDALAFTRGADVYFRAGAYDPVTPAGKRLLAHELAHVVQQRPGVNRAPAPGLGAGVVRRKEKSGSSDKEPKGTKERVERTSGPVGTIDITAPRKKTLELDKLKVPEFKSEFFKNSVKRGHKLQWRRGAEAREDKQRTLWLTNTDNLAAAKTSFGLRTEQLEPGSKEPFRLQSHATTKASNYYYTGKTADIVAALVIPPWNREGQHRIWEADHGHEWQVGGEDEIENLWLLPRKINDDSGKLIKKSLEDQIDNFLEAANKELIRPVKGGHRALKSGSWTVTWKDVEEDNSIKLDNTDYWKREEIGKPFFMKGLDKLDAKSAPQLVGTSDKLAIYYNKAGGRVDPVKTQDKKKGTTDLKVGGGTTFAVTWTLKGPAGEPGPNNPDQPITGKVGHVVGDAIRTNKKGDVVQFLSKALKMNILGMPGVEWGGFLDIEALRELRAEKLAEASFASPVVFDDLTFDLQQGLGARGRIPKPTLKLLERTAIFVTLSGGNVGIEATITGDDLNLPGPLKVQGGALTLTATTGGLGVDGRIDFEIEKLAKGYLAAGAKAKAGQADFELDGALQFDTAMFTKAELGLSYKAGKWGVRGELGIGPGKVTGIKSASARVDVTDETVTAAGEFETSLKGVDKGTLGFLYKPETGMEISGEILLGQGIPGIRGGKLAATVKEGPEGWSLAGDVTAEPAVPGLTGTVKGTYADGAFGVEADLAYERGLAKGTVKAGLTNRTLGPDGLPTGPIDKSGALTAYGGGTVTLAITPWLQGTVGLRLTPKGEIEVTGRVELPDHFDVFEEKKVERKVLSIGIDLPIVGVAVAGQRIGIFATIRGGLTASAGFGPGQLRDVALAVTYNPDRPDDTHVTGGGSFVVPARAGLRLQVDGGLGVGIPVVSATAGVSIYGEVGLEGAASAAAAIDWTPRTGIVLDARGEVFVEPKFRFGVDAFVDVTADLWITEIELYHRTWKLAAFEYGSNLRFGLAFPLHYESGKPFDVSFDQIQWTYPQIDPSDLLGGLMKQLVG
ncbi:eCIS core domain-containing protein [Pseudonocardia lacus]|uniref:eCIS core domain-containing protein n=1 Tax=Pseudonocardia lacus TaxID=2835865 RepID=UPI001BDD4058|nr:DUF4157 domain-containing protein [Pseudonocardia lacus]